MSPRDEVKVVIQGVPRQNTYVAVPEIAVATPFLCGEDAEVDIARIRHSETVIPIVPWRCSCGAAGSAGWGRVGNTLYGFVTVGTELDADKQKTRSELFFDLEARLNIMAAWLKYKRDGAARVDEQAERDMQGLRWECPRD